MSISFFHKLTVERCQHSLAQLSAALFVMSCMEQSHPGGQTVQALIEILNRDLSILNGYTRDMPSEEYEAANEA